MLKLHQLFFRRFIALFAISLFFIGFFTYSTIKNIELARIEENLKSVILINQLHLNNEESLDQYAELFKKTTHIRITIIDLNGTVIAESDKDKHLLHNHKNRKEIILAEHNEFGQDIRQSDTVNKDMIYVAKKIRIGENYYYLRVSRYVNEFNYDFLFLSFQVLFLMVIFFMMAFIAAYNLNNQIRFEIDKIANFLKDLTEKNFNIEITSQFSSEFNKIASTLTKVAQKLKKREEKKAQRTLKLKQLNRQKDEIISAISHEFKNPIAVINGYCETLINDKDINPTIRDKFLDKIANSAKRLTNMIDRLRLVTKLEDKQFKTTFKECNINQICHRIISNIKVEYPSRVVNFESVYIKTVIADEVLLEMAILNLVENAIKYSELDITIKYEENQISVKDNGIGIQESELSKITDKFYRINSNVWNNSLGLGLNIVQNILRLQNFKLQITSEVGVGSTFSILFSLG